MTASEKPTILIVDDTKDNLDLLTGLLESDYRIRAAPNGKIALKIVKSGGLPDLILLDIMMPEMDGYEVCEKLKADPETRDIPVIFVTAKNEVDDETRGFEQGASDFISKPISPPILKARVKSQIDLKKSTDTIRDLPRKLGRYFSPHIAKAILEDKSEDTIKTSRKKLTILFSDLCGFTSASESMEPEDLSYCINTYLGRMAETVVEFGGTLDKFMGDGIMAFFGDPESRGIKEDALACVAMALKMHERILDLVEEFQSQGIDKELQARIGIHTGYCNVGNFGSEHHMDYTLLGRNVNMASRLESSGENGKIHISAATYTIIKEDFACEAREEPIHFKGFDRPLQTYFVKENLNYPSFVI
jgi:adenylate cyclase